MGMDFAIGRTAGFCVRLGWNLEFCRARARLYNKKGIERERESNGDKFTLHLARGIFIAGSRRRNFAGTLFAHKFSLQSRASSSSL